jgi:outer membrane protein assembly factor BamB
MDVDAEGDKVAWKKDGVTDIITTSDSRVYVRHGGDKISALELETGEVIWTDRLLPGTHVTGGSPGQGVLYVADRTGAAVAFGEL